MEWDPATWTGRRLSSMNMLRHIFWPFRPVPLGLPCIINEEHHLGTRSHSRVKGWQHRGTAIPDTTLSLSLQMCPPTQAMHRQNGKVNYQFCEAEPSNLCPNDQKGRMRQWTRMFPFSSYNGRELSTSPRGWLSSRCPDL